MLSEFKAPSGADRLNLKIGIGQLIDRLKENAERHAAMIGSAPDNGYLRVLNALGFDHMQNAIVEYTEHDYMRSEFVIEFTPGEYDCVGKEIAQKHETYRIHEKHVELATEEDFYQYQLASTRDQLSRMGDW